MYFKTYISTLFSTTNRILVVAKLESKTRTGNKAHILLLLKPCTNPAEVQVFTFLQLLYYLLSFKCANMQLVSYACCP